MNSRAMKFSAFMRRFLFFIVSFFISLMLLFNSPTSAFANTAHSVRPLEEGDVIYQVLVDRFADGDSSNNDFGHGEYNPNDLGFYHGGDWKGLTNHLSTNMPVIAGAASLLRLIHIRMLAKNLVFSPVGALYAINTF